MDYTEETAGGRSTRQTATETPRERVRFLSGPTLSELLAEPSADNYRRWLRQENNTSSDRQSVVLLVTETPDNDEKEIFMYDVATGQVNKLSGELSSAFVEAAETNAEEDKSEKEDVEAEAQLSLEDVDLQKIGKGENDHTEVELSNIQRIYSTKKSNSQTRQ